MVISALKAGGRNDHATTETAHRQTFVVVYCCFLVKHLHLKLNRNNNYRTLLCYRHPVGRSIQIFYTQDN